MADILLIENDDLTRESMRNMLGLAGHSVVMASNGPAGIKFHRTEAFDLIIMDVFSPLVQGLEAIGILRGSGDKVRILASSVMTDMGKRLGEAKQLGADGVLVNPFQRHELVTALNGLLPP